MSQFTIIHNPQRLFLQHEVWYKGKGESQDSQGYRVEVDVCKKVESFSTHEKAEGFIKYQQDVRQFRGVR